MLIIESFGISIAVLMIGLTCWGTWGMLLNQTGLKFEVSTVYFICGQVILSCLVCFTFGMVSTDLSPDTFPVALQRVDPLGAAAAVLGGALIAYANMLLTKAINIGGLAVAVPSVIGTGLVGGTVLNYLIDPEGDALLLFGGVACCAVSLVLGSVGYSMKGAQSLRDITKESGAQTVTASEREPEKSRCDENFGQASIDVEMADSEAMSSKSIPKSPEKKQDHHEIQFVPMVLACGFGGILSALWSPVSVWASTERGLGSYECLFFFNFGQLFVIPPLVWKIEMVRELKADGWGTMKQQVTSLVAGFINCGGLVAMFVAGKAVSFAMAFGILQCCPLVAALWGVYHGEMRGASPGRTACFASMMLLYSLAIVAIAMSQA